MLECCASVLRDAPSPMRTWPEVPPALERVGMRCLEKDRTQRYASARQLREALLPFAEK